MMAGIPALSALILLPLVGAAVTAILPSERPEWARRVAVVFGLAALAWVLALWVQYDAASGTMQFVERAPWITPLGVEHLLGVDGLSLLLLLLTAIVTPFAMLAPQPPHPESAGRRKAYFALLLVLEAMVFGVFLSLNFIQWFLFWELSLIPAFLLVKMWGGSARTAAAYSFFIYTFVGSIAMLLAFLGIFLATGEFDLLALAEMGRGGELASALRERFGQSDGGVIPKLIFGGIFLGLAVKAPVVPFHTWLPPAYSEAPPGVSILFAALLSKMGLYGFVRILLPLFPDQMEAARTLLLVLAVATILLPALAALAQTDLKRIIAYSSLNHIGYCLLGIFAVATAAEAGPAAGREAALSGAILQMFNHGVTVAALFCFVGWIEARGGGLRGLNDFGGLRRVAPVLCGLMGISLFASLGLPGLNGFPGEFLIFSGTFSVAAWAAVVALPGLLITAVFLLRIMGSVFSGSLSDTWKAFPDLTVGERVAVLPIVGIIVAAGVFPGVFLHVVNQTVLVLLEFTP